MFRSVTPSLFLLVEIHAAEIDGGDVELVLDLHALGFQRDFVRGAAFDLAHGDRANLAVRLRKVRNLNLFLLARRELASDWQDVEHLLRRGHLSGRPFDVHASFRPGFPD